MKIFFGLILFLCGMNAPALAVPAAPNETAATGTVVEYCISSSTGSPAAPKPGPGLFKIVVRIEAAEDRGDALNFLKGKEGQEISFWSRNRLNAGLFGKKVKAIVEYRGDERGGKFWLKRVKIIQ